MATKVLKKSYRVYNESLYLKTKKKFEMQNNCKFCFQTFVNKCMVIFLKDID
jgi:hypothetical protein